MRAEFLHVFFSLELEDEIFGLNQLARERDVLSSLELVPSQHPDFDVRFLEGGDRIRYLILKPVLDSCSSQQGQIRLKIRVDFVEQLLSVDNIFLSFIHVLEELVEFFDLSQSQSEILSSYSDLQQRIAILISQSETLK